VGAKEAVEWNCASKDSGEFTLYIQISSFFLPTVSLLTAFKITVDMRKK